MVRLLLAGASIAAIYTSVAHAQATPPMTPPDSTTTQAHAATRNAGVVAEAAQGAPDAGIADIIVTATKVETTLQRTAQAITAIDGRALERQGVSNVQELDKLVGGLQIERNGASAGIFIRGIGARVLSPQSDPAVAFSLDGVYFARDNGLSATLFDIARVEVVKGPQGTLYGRNATGGAVNVITNRPRLGVRGLDGEIEVGDYHSIRTVLGVNLPIGEDAAIRLAGQTINHHGYLSDGFDDDDTRAARASFLYQPSEGFSIYLSGDYGHQGGKGAGAIPRGPGSNNNALTTQFVVPGSPFTGPSDPRINAFVNAASPADAIPVPLPGVYCAGLPFPPGAPVVGSVVGKPALLLCNTPLGVDPNPGTDFIDDSFYGANATIEADAGIGQVTAIGGYRGTKINTQFRVDPGPQRTRSTVDQFTGEIRLASKPNSGRLQWLIGGFYLHEKQDSASIIARNNGAISNPIPTPGSPLPASTCVGPLDPDGPGPAPAIPGLCLAQATVIQRSFQISDPAVIDESYAAFGQATFSLTDRFRVTGGIRYTHERKAEEDGLITAIYTAPAGVTTSYPSEGKASFNDVSYRAGIEYDVAPRAMLYANVSTAFHAGGINLGVQAGPNIYLYKPEKVRSYVAGVKSRFLDNRLQLNVEGFWLDYRNYQQSQLGRVNDGSAACTGLGIVAACPITLRIENAATARIRGVEGDLTYTPVRDTVFNVNVLYNDARFGRFVLADPFTGAPTDYSHNRLPNGIPWTITGGVSQGFPMANGGRIVADARTQYRTGTYMYFVHTPGNYQKAYSRTDLGLTYEAPKARFSVTAFVRNVENKATLSQGSEFDSSTKAVFIDLNPPRTYGINVGFHF